MVSYCKDRSVFGGAYSEFTLINQVPNELGMMVARGLASVTAAGFLKELTQGVIEDVENHVLGVGRLRVIVAPSETETMEPVAFAASNVKMQSVYCAGSTRILHLGGIIVAPEYQGRGIGKKLVKSEMEETGADLLAFHTQNQHMLDLGTALTHYSYILSSVYAKELGTKNPSERVVAGEKRVVDQGRYGKMSLYGKRRRDMAIKELGVGGDAIFFVGERR